MNEFIGQSEGYINKIESGYSLPSLSGFFYICEFLDHMSSLIIILKMMIKYKRY